MIKRPHFFLKIYLLFDFDQLQYNFIRRIVLYQSTRSIKCILTAMFYKSLKKGIFQMFLFLF